MSWVRGFGWPFAVVVPPDSDETWVDGDYLTLMRMLAGAPPVDGFLWTAKGVRV